jgi:hypothetical protein
VQHRRKSEADTAGIEQRRISYQRGVGGLRAQLSRRFGPLWRPAPPAPLLLPIVPPFQAVSALAMPCRSDCTPRKRLIRAGKGKLRGIPSRAVVLNASKAPRWMSGRK